MRRNTLTTAVLAGLTGLAGMASVSHAVNVNPDGLGQVLLYPYYTARGGNDTLISIVNTTERGKAVKIRFIEALNSREVLDFNIYMSPYDVWTAAVTASGDGAKLTTNDTTCTVPYIFGQFPDGVDFLTFELDDGGPSDFERTASGYIEVIEMGTMLPVPSSAPPATDGSIIPWVTKHVAGVPRDCDIPVAAWTEGAGLPWRDENNSNFGFDIDLGATGGLFGSASVINVAEGTMFTYNATAIDGFWAAGTMNHTRPDSLLPNLSTGNNFDSFVFNNGALISQTWGISRNAVNATITHDSIMNEYITDTEFGARTEWVLTFPTKRFHTDAAGSNVQPDQPDAPFTRTWHETPTGLHYACEDLTIGFWDREESTPTAPVGPPIFSPPPPDEDPDVFQLCREANVIRFGQSGEPVPGATEILGETSRAQAPLGFTNFNLPYDAGWTMIDLANIPAASPLGPATRTSEAASDGTQLAGLPVIGFSVTTYTNGTLAGGVLSNYGGTFNHRGSRSVVRS